MKTILFFAMAALALAYLLARARIRPSTNFQSVDVIVPAFNEAPVIERSLINILRNPYVRRVICVDDGSTDGTGEIVARLMQQTPRLLLVSKDNGGKGSAIMKGVVHVTAAEGFLTDAGT